MNNLPSEIKSVSFFRNFIDKMKLAKSDKESQQIISSLRKHPRFSVYKASYVKFLSHIMCENDPDMCVFFADGDNIRVANELAAQKANEINIKSAKELNLPSVASLKHPVTGEALVDKDIESILLQIKAVNQRYGYGNSLVGINGDEIFITIPHLKNEDKQKIYNEYRQVGSGFLTISVRLF